MKLSPCYTFFVMRLKLIPFIALNHSLVQNALLVRKAVLLVRNALFKAVCALFLCFTLMTHTHFVLITSLYNETNPRRIKEYEICLKKNLVHPDIERIHVLYDDAQSTANCSGAIWDLIHADKRIVVDVIHGRPSFGQCFDLANELYPNKTILVSNADIFFNKTLHPLVDLDMTNRFFAITRWNVTADAKLKPYVTNRGKPRIDSNDTWIFKTPFTALEADDILLGTQHCDIYLAYRALNSDLLVHNPCLSIQCAHLHLSNIRHYPKIKPKMPISTLRWCTLKDAMNDR